jgi:hypothetical protein
MFASFKLLLYTSINMNYFGLVTNANVDVISINYPSEPRHLKHGGVS